MWSTFRLKRLKSQGYCLHFCRTVLVRVLNSAAARVSHSGCVSAWSSEGSEFVIVGMLMYFIIWNVKVFKMFCCCVLCCLQFFFKVLPPTQSLSHLSLTCRYGYCHSGAATVLLLHFSASVRQKCNTVVSCRITFNSHHFGILTKQFLLFWCTEGIVIFNGGIVSS